MESMKLFNPIFRSRFARAFSLVEILGATALVATIAAVSVLSVKDTLMSGQRSAVQKELQNLNTALSNYKSAGGVISDNATARDAVDRLKEGVVLAGSNTEYKPLLSDPDFEVSIGGEVYGLDYAPADGFSYSPASGEGEKFSQAGASEAVGGGGTYPFDITSPTEVLQDFAGMDPNDPAYADYIKLDRK